MRHRRRIAGGIAVALILAGLTTARSQSILGELPPMSGALLTEKTAYMVLPPEFVAGPIIRQVQESPNGDYLLVVREVQPALQGLTPPNPQTEVQLLLWNCRTRKSTVLWRSASTLERRVALSSVAWLPGTNSAFAQATFATIEENKLKSVEGRLLRIDAPNADAKTIMQSAGPTTLFVGGAKPVVALLSTEQNTLRVLNADGVPGRPIVLSRKDIVLQSWLEEGKTLFGYRSERDAQNLPIRAGYAIYDITTGEYTLTDKRPTFPSYPSPVRDVPFRIVFGKGELRHKELQLRLSPLWLEGTDKTITGSVLVAADGNMSQVLRTGVHYRSGESLYFAPIVRADREALMGLVKNRLMQNGKQIALAMLMYNQDYDELFPPADGDIQNLIQPYLKNSNIFLDPLTNRPIFELNPYKNPSLSSFTTPSTTAMGYLTGPGGRAIIYVDGHVKWEGTP
jgi:hypothetical protein